MPYLKHNSGNTSKQAPAKKTKETPAPIDRKADYAESDYRHSRCVEEALDGLTGVISSAVTQARDGDFAQPLYSDPSGYPVKLTFDGEQELSVTLFLEGNAVDSIADSLKRIADALSAHRG